jgi:hypothetical protein
MSLNSIKACTDRLTELGVKGKHVFRTLADAKAAVARVEARQAGKPMLAAPASAKSTAPTVAAKSVSARESLLTAIENEKSPGAKADLYAKLSTSYLAEISKTSDQVAKTELMRAYARSEKNRGYCLHAEASLDPKAAKARKLMRVIE